MVCRVAKTFSQPKRSPSTINGLLDMQTLLLRCAAAGRNSSKICAPVPVEFANTTGGGTPARLVFAASDQMYVHGFNCEEHQQKQIQQNNGRLEEAWTLLSFLLSLPWTGGSCLEVEKSASENPRSNNHGDGYSFRTLSQNKVGRLCLDIGTALGDESPVFSCQANKYGTIKAYHGTKIESAWSILNHGLQNLSYNGELSQNGAMMGEGVYLSSSRQVAESFAIKAAERPPLALHLAFQHESLLRLLCHTEVDVASLNPLDDYDITCLPVFEATIIKPPPLPTDEEEERNNKNHTTRQEGKYFVCEDSNHIRITKLHLTIELSKKPDVWRWVPSRLPISWIVLLVAILWIIR